MKCNYTVPKDMITSGRDWLKKNVAELDKQLHDPKVENRTISIQRKTHDLAEGSMLSLCLGQSPDKKVVAGFGEGLEIPDAGSTVLLTITLKNNNREQQANLFYKRLMELANDADGTEDWDHTVVMVRKLLGAHLKPFDIRLLISIHRRETTALALRAVLSMEPNNSEKVESIKRWLMLQRGKDGWNNTKTTAEVFLVLLKDDLAQPHSERYKLLDGRTKQRQCNRSA